MKKVLSLFVCVLLLTTVFAGCVSAEEEVTLKFAQWWEPELPDGAFRGLMDEFEAANPGVKVELLSNPYNNNQELMMTGAATGTLPDVVGLDGPWLFNFVQQGALTDLTTMMEEHDYDQDQLAAQLQVGGRTYAFPVTNFVYPLFVNNDLLAQAGVEVPTTRGEFVEAAKAVAALGDNISGYGVTMSLENPGLNNDVISWIYATNGNIFGEDGRPAVESEEAKGVMEMLKDLNDAGALTPGASSSKEQDKVEEFINGRLGFMIDTLAHLVMIRDGNPDLNFSVIKQPGADDYDGETGMVYASWSVGMSANTEHPEEAWKLVEFLMSEEANAKLSNWASALPGNKNAAPDMSSADPIFIDGYEIFQQTHLMNQWNGIPSAIEMQRLMAEQYQLYMEGDIEVDEMLSASAEAWNEILDEAYAEAE